jgi:ATP-dependent Lhr-like helicase
MLPALKPIETWFHRQGWQPLPFQQQAWDAYLAGRSGLIQVPTGSGKTYAAVLGPLAEMLTAPPTGATAALHHPAAGAVAGY